MTAVALQPSVAEDLLARHQAGDPAAFPEFVATWRSRVVQFFLRQCLDRDRAEDLAQELFLRLLRRVASYRPEGRMSLYVFRAATNLWIDHFRRAAPRPRFCSFDQGGAEEGAGGWSEPAGVGPTPEECAVAAEDRTALRVAMAQLPEGQRAVLELAVRDELPYAAIAARLHIPVGTVKSRVHAAVATLRERLHGPRSARRASA